FEAHVSLKTLPYLADHRVGSRTVFPAAAYLELAVAAAEQDLGPGPKGVEDVVFHEPLLVPDDGGVTVQVTRADGPASIQVCSLDSKQLWPGHATGGVSVAPPPAAPEPLDDIVRRCSEPLDPGAHYEALRAQGLEYGPAFRGVRELRRGTDEAL